MDIIRFLGGGLLSETDYERWKPKRRAFDPAFHKRLATISYGAQYYGQIASYKN